MAKETNILLLGETGVGKSTFINAFVNYLTHETLEEAKSSPVCLIPARFIITDENYEPIKIEFKNEKNESYETVTQNCRAYCFNYGEIMVRLIDTPGIGDTRGVDQDKTNFENLLSFIAAYEELHLICIVLLPDMPRFTDSFNYCLKQMLSQLHKDAKDNMVFLFTNCRATFYRPKNTIILLREVLRDIKSGPPFVDILLDKSTMYCLDNDSFQLLIALHTGIKFSDEEIDDYSNSWNKLVNECKRLMDYITTGNNGKPLPPQSIQNIVSINETRRLILALNGPIIKMTERIDQTTDQLIKYRNELESYSGDFKTILEQLNANICEVSFFDIIPGYNLFSLPYKAIRANFAKRNREELMKQLITVNDNKRIKEQLLNEMRQTIEDFKQEKQFIIETTAKFSIFLKNNAITAYNDVFKDLLSTHIENLKTSSGQQSQLEKKYSNLSKILDDYEIEKKIMETSIFESNDCSEISLESVNSQIRQLYELKITGNEIKQWHKESKSRRACETKVEVHHTIPQSKTERFFNKALISIQIELLTK